MKWLGIAALTCALACACSTNASAAAKRPDLAVRDVTIKTRVATVNAHPEVTIANLGRAASRPADVAVSLTRIGSASTIRATARVRSVRAGGARTLRVAVPFPRGAQGGRYRVRACVDPARRQREASKSNNCRSARGALTFHDTTPPYEPGLATRIQDTPAGPILVVTASTEPFAKVRLYLHRCSGDPLAAGPADSTGRFVGAISLRPDSSQFVTATAEDRAGHVSVCGARYYGNPLRPPVPPTLVARQAGTRVRISAGPQPGETFAVYRNGDCAGEPILTGTSDQGQAGVEVDAPVGEQFFTAVAINRYGVRSACTARVTYVHDETAFKTFGVVSNPPSPANVSRFDLTSQLAPDEHLVVFKAADCSGSSIHSGSAGGSVSVTAPQDASTTFGVAVADGSGHRSPCLPFSFTESSRWESESNDSVLAAARASERGVVIDQTEDYFGRIWPDENDVDTYKLAVAATSAISTAVLDADGTATCPAEVDILLEVLYPDGSVAAADGNAGSDACPQIEFEADPGTYYLRVSDDTADPEAPATYEYRLSTVFGSPTAP